MSDTYKKWRARFWRLFREPVYLGETVYGWPRHLVEGDYYKSITGEFYEIRDGVWKERPPADN